MAELERKKCGLCKIVKPIWEFKVMASKASKKGWRTHSWCKLCLKKKQAVYMIKSQAKRRK